jgi:hypothetical protein
MLYHAQLRSLRVSSGSPQLLPLAPARGPWLGLSGLAILLSCAQPQFRLSPAMATIADLEALAAEAAALAEGGQEGHATDDAWAMHVRWSAMP